MTNTKVRKGRYLELITKLNDKEQARIQGKIKEIQQKDKEMANKTTEPKITLEHGKTYVTAGGVKVRMVTCSDFIDPTTYKFLGDNGLPYSEQGSFGTYCERFYSEHIIVSEYKEPQVQPKLYTEAHREIAEAYQDGLNAGNTFTTSELQSLTKMQSKVITALEAEILELKETAAYLGNCSYPYRVGAVRKQIFNEITIKKKRLVKLVALQSKLKRTK